MTDGIKGSHSAEYASEYNISDLFSLISRRSYLFMTVFGITLLIGICLAVLTPKQYLFYRYIQVGSYTDNKGNGEEIALIQKPEQLVDAIQMYFIPVAWDEVTSHTYLSKKKSNIQVKKISDSGIISVEAKARAEEANVYDKVFNGVLSHVVDAQQYILIQKQKILESKLSLSQAELANRAHVGLSQEDNDVVSPKNDTNASKLFGALKGGSTLRFIAEPSNFELRSQVQAIKVYLNNMRPTQFISEFKRSDFPVGLNGISIMGLFTLLGLVLGVICVLFIEAINKIRKTN